jgi:hypothetical protein
MKTQTTKFLTGLAALIAAGITTQAQYIWTALDDPLAMGGTVASGISGANIVGGYSDSNGIHGFLYNGSNYTTLDDPLAVNGTRALGISGTNIVG